MHLSTYTILRIILFFVVSFNCANAQESVIIYGPYVSNFKIDGEVKFRKINRFKTEKELKEGLEKFFGPEYEFSSNRNSNLVQNYKIDFKDMRLLYLDREGWPELYEMDFTGDDVTLVFGDFEFKIKTSIKALQDQVSTVENVTLERSVNVGYYTPHFHGHSYYFELILGVDGDTIERIIIYNKIGI